MNVYIVISTPPSLPATVFGVFKDRADAVRALMSLSITAKAYISIVERPLE